MTLVSYLVKTQVSAYRYPMPTVFRLAEVLEAKGLSQAEVARRAGLSVRTVARLCRNETAQVSLATLDALSVALKVQPGELITRR